MPQSLRRPSSRGRPTPREHAEVLLEHGRALVVQLLVERQVRGERLQEVGRVALLARVRRRALLRVSFRGHDLGGCNAVEGQLSSP